MQTHNDTAPATGHPPRRAVITGASSGIGLQCCKDLLERGWTVVGLDMTPSPLSEDPDIADRFESLTCDIAQAAEVGPVFERIAEGGPIDALICSAGVARGGKVLTMEESDFSLVFDVNVKGTWLVAKAAYDGLKASRHAPARIVFLSSGAALRPKIGGAVYSASKIALINLAKVMAVELAAENILVNVVAPATVDTPFIDKIRNSQAGFKITGESPLGRVAQPSDVTGVIRFLLSAESAYMTGSVVTVDGGTTAAFVPPD